MYKQTKATNDPLTEVLQVSDDRLWLKGQIPLHDYILLMILMEQQNLALYFFFFYRTLEIFNMIEDKKRSRLGISLSHTRKPFNLFIIDKDYWSRLSNCTQRQDVNQLLQLLVMILLKEQGPKETNGQECYVETKTLQHSLTLMLVPKSRYIFLLKDLWVL